MLRTPNVCVCACIVGPSGHALDEADDEEPDDPLVVETDSEGIDDSDWEKLVVSCEERKRKRDAEWELEQARRLDAEIDAIIDAQAAADRDPIVVEDEQRWEEDQDSLDRFIDEVIDGTDHWPSDFEFSPLEEPEKPAAADHHDEHDGAELAEDVADTADDTDDEIYTEGALADLTETKIRNVEYLAECIEAR